MAELAVVLAFGMGLLLIGWLRRFHKRLQKQQSFLRQVIDAVPGAVFVKDREGRFLMINRAGAAIYNTTAENLLGKTDRDVNASPAQTEHFLAVNREVMATLQPQSAAQEIIPLSTGEPQWYQTTISPFVDDRGQVQGVIGAATNITALKRVEEELRQAKEAAEAANQAKSTFLASVTHELRSPLNAILGFSELLKLNASLPSDQQEYIDMIHQSGEYLLTLITNILDMSKIEAGRTVLTPNPFDLQMLLTSLENLFRLQARAKCLQLQIKCAPDVPRYIQTDEVKLRQVLINLVGNAIKFTQAGSVTVQVHLEAAATPPDSVKPIALAPYPASGFADFAESLSVPSATPLPLACLEFAVADTGIGIDPDERDSIFEAFVQAGKGKLAGEGTGLGLTISRSFVRLMGGELTVSSQPNKGSTFRFQTWVGVLPTAIERATPGKTNTEAEPSSLEKSTSLERLCPALERASDHSALVVHLRAVLRRLTSNWSRCLHDAILEGDLDTVLSLIRQVKEHSAPVADQLTLLAQRLEYDRLLSILRQLME